jgi:uncharacterized protein YkwD
VWIVAVLIGLEGTASVPGGRTVQRSLELRIDVAGLAADFVFVSRTKAFLVASVVAVAVVLGGTASPARSGSQQETQLLSLNRQIVLAINQFRRAHGLPTLRISSHLNGSARQHSLEMGADGYFAHNSANGTAWWKRIRHYYPPAPDYGYWSVGENLLYSPDDIGAAAALKLWIASPPHLANLMNRNFRDLGVSSVHVDQAGGVYGGSPVTIITTDFGARD